jgi:trimeric autotransporter adhesin
MKAEWNLRRMAVLSGALSVLARSAPGDEYWESPVELFPAEAVVRTLAVQGGDLYAGGAFERVAGMAATNVARWDGMRWFALGAGIPGTVETITVTGEGVFVGGSFSEAGLVATTNVARWDGAHWNPLGAGLNNRVFALAPSPQGVFAGGYFSRSGGATVKGIGEWEGSDWVEVGGGVSDSLGGSFVKAIAVQGASMYAGGSFTAAGSTPALNVARWDGTNWSALGGGLNATVHALAVTPTALYAGGNFNQPVGAAWVAGWDGTGWSRLGSGITSDRTPGIVALTVNGADLFVGGVEFSGAGGVLSTNIVRWTGQKWCSLGQGITGPFGGMVNALCANGSELLVGGYFDRAGGRPASAFAIWHIPHALKITHSTNEAVISWPSTGTNFVLEAKQVVEATNWSAVSPPASVVGDECVVTNSLDGPQKLYRLRR